MPWGLYCQKLQDKNERERAVQSDFAEGGCCAVHISDTVLSVVHLSTQAAHLQIHSDLFSICSGGFPKARASQGTLSHCAQIAALPSLGRERVRSCALSMMLWQGIFRKFAKTTQKTTKFTTWRRFIWATFALTKLFNLFAASSICANPISKCRKK